MVEMVMIMQNFYKLERRFLLYLIYLLLMIIYKNLISPLMSMNKFMINILKLTKKFEC